MKFGWRVAATIAIGLAGACAAPEGEPQSGAPTDRTAQATCSDGDDDGYGRGCAAGPDCNDQDPSVHVGCLHCAQPNAGCECETGAQPVACFLEKTETDDGTVMCHEGTRYCRDNSWSGCESIHSYPFPEAPTATSLIDPDAGPIRCNDCSVNCYRITDTLTPVDGGLSDAGENVGWAQGGGLTLGSVPDSGMPDVTLVIPPEIPECMLHTGNDPDCDGILNPFDADPTHRPFATTNAAIFLDIAPGQTGRGTIDLDFFINSADVYFLVDQSGSMDGERDRLKLDLTTGDFIQDADFDCADYDHDLMPNNELKTQGIVGAIRCIIRDTNFGVGFFREIPFTNYVYSDQVSDHVAYWNYHDISTDVTSVLGAINRLETHGNRDWEEASMLALNSVLTGNGMYFGVDRRGVPPRQGCPEDTWGYPCFRDPAIPIVVMFTDAQFHNGPDSNDFAYDNSRLEVNAGSGDQYYPLPDTNEAFETVADLGDLTSSFKTFTGDTREMSADLPASIFSCLSNSDGNDAVFKFNITQQRPVKIETTGSQFDTVLSLYTGVPGTPSGLPASTNANEVATTAYDFGQVYDSYVQMAGNTNAMAADYQWSDVTCNAAGGAPDAVFKFNLSAAARVAVDASGSSYDTVLGLYSAAPTLPPSYTAIANTNEQHDSAYVVGDVYNQSKGYSGSTATMLAQYSAAQAGCNADNGANDAVYSFSLSQPTRVRVSSEGSSYDTVLSLFNSSANPIGSASVPPTNEVQSNAYDAGVLDNRIFALTGSTATMTADIGRTPIGCNSNDYAPEAVFKFTLNATADVQIDTIGTAFDGVISLHNQAIDANTTYTTVNNTNEDFASALDLGSLNAREVRILGGSTGDMEDDYDTWDNHPNVSCSSWSGAYAPDAAYKFSLATPTLVRIDLAGSSYDTALSLHRSAPNETSTAAGTANDTQASAIDVGVIDDRSFLRTGSTGSLNHNYFLDCETDPSPRDAVYKFTVNQTTEVQIDTDNSTFDTVIGLYPATISAAPNPTDVDNDNRTSSTAHNMGSLNNAWKTFIGSTEGAGSDHWEQRCDSDSSADDAYFKFTLSSTRNVQINAEGTEFDAVLMLYRQNGSGWTHVTCAHNNDGTDILTANSLGANTYLVVIKGDRSSDEGDYKLSFRDTAVSATPNQIECDDNGGSVGAASGIVRTLSPGTYHVVVSGKNPGASGTYTLRFRDKDYWESFAELECDNDDAPGTASVIERQLAAGNYWFLVKGYNSSASGPYSLRVTDVNPPPEAIPAITCDDNSGGGTAARITRNALPAGDYWVVLKGNEDADKGNYVLNIRDTLATASGTMLQCDDDGGDANSSVIERNLDPGTYQVVVKGDAPTDEGSYKLSFRDVTQRPFNRLACDDDSGADTSSYVEQSLTAGEYYVVLKGNEPTHKGPYTLSVRDVTHRPLSSTFCDDNGSTQTWSSDSGHRTPPSVALTSKISQTLNPGTYYVAVKGKNADAAGPYQLSIGGGTTHDGYFDPPTWSETLTAIQSSGAHVIPILSCHDDPQHGDDDYDCEQARDQAIDLANASDALGENLQPLQFDIDGDGGGLSRTVVNAIAELANYLEMDVKVRVMFEPDDNPGFLTTIRAVPTSGNGCSGIIGVEHQNCVPGASPKFEIDFENPLGAPVPDNPMDPNGGYHFRAELIGDDQFIIDSVPIYILPRNVFPDMGPPVPDYHTTGEYWQDSAAPGCVGNLRPDWRDLSWNADIHPGTTVTFSACTAENPDDLETCTPREIATVTGVGSCTNPDGCPLGYCDTDIHVCQVARAGTCVADDECALNAVCDPDEGKCTYDSQPVYIGAAISEGNFRSYLRMVIALSAETGFEEPPVVHSWEMTYYCNNVL